MITEYCPGCKKVVITYCSEDIMDVPEPFKPKIVTIFCSECNKFLVSVTQQEAAERTERLDRQ